MINSVTSSISYICYLSQNLIKNGIFSSIPFVAFVIVALLSGQIADLLRKTCLPTVIVRKLFTTAGNKIIHVVF